MDAVEKRQEANSMRGFGGQIDGIEERKNEKRLSFLI